MKDTSRPHPVPSSRSAPYRKCRLSGNTSPGTRRPYDASLPQPPGHTDREAISPSERALSSRRDEAQTSRAQLHYSADNERRTLPRTGENRGISHTRRYTITDGSTRERLPHTNGLSTHADVPGPSLRLPLTSVPPTTNTFAVQSKAESPPPGSVAAFLRSIELPDKLPWAPPTQKSFSLSTPPSLCLAPFSADRPPSRTNENGYQVSLAYKGYSFTYDLSALPDDPKGAIALLNITKSDPGAYILVGAHYRRTGRSRAACTVIKSLLDALDTPSDVEKGKGDAILPPGTATSTVTLVSSCSKPIDCTRPVFKSAAMRPAMLLLAACEMDISREHPDDPKSASHASTAHELFRTVYGTVNDAIVAGAVRPAPKNALGLKFSSNTNGVSSPLSASNSNPPSNAKLPLSDTESLGRVKDLEEELGATRDAQKKLQEKLMATNDRLTRANDKVYALESRSREVRHRLDASQGEIWELRRRLADCEQRERELAQFGPNAENRVWGRLKDLLFDSLGGGVRGL